MKKIILLIVLWIFINGSKAQDSDSIYLKTAADSLINLKTRINFAVPDLPAFKALGIDPSNILRPSSNKDLAIMFNNFANTDGAFIIPKNFAAEISPALLIKPWYTLDQFRSNGFLQAFTKTSVSIGTNKEAKTGINSIAAGVRTTLIDNGDYRLNEAFLKESVYDKQDKLTIELFELEVLTRKNLKLTIPQWDGLTPARKKVLMDSVGKIIKKDKLIQNFDNDFKTELEKFKKKNWNASRLDFAYSILMQSPDSLLGNTKVTKHLFWLTYAIKPGRNNNWGQIIIGINNTINIVNSKSYNDFTGNFRFYAGGNSIKGFFESQYRNNESPLIKQEFEETLYFQMGIEANIYKGVWMHFGTGVMSALKGNTRSQLIGNINLFLTLPEDFKLF
jgi:hypothetical protein